MEIFIFIIVSIIYFIFVSKFYVKNHSLKGLKVSISLFILQLLAYIGNFLSGSSFSYINHFSDSFIQLVGNLTQSLFYNSFAIFGLTIAIVKCRGTKEILPNYIKLFEKENRKCSRENFWIFVLFNFYIILVPVLLIMIIDSIYEYGANWEAYYFFGTLLCLILGLLTIILGTKRLRDVGISPWFMLLSLVPYVNIILIILLCLPSNIVKSKISTTI